MSYNLKCFERLNRMVGSFVLFCDSFCLWVSSFQVPAFSPFCPSSILEPPDQIFAHRKKIAWHLAPRTVQSCEFQVIWCDMWYVQHVGSKFWQFRDHLALKTGCTTFYTVVFWIIDGTSPDLNFPKKQPPHEIDRLPLLSSSRSTPRQSTPL